MSDNEMKRSLKTALLCLLILPAARDAYAAPLVTMHPGTQAVTLGKTVTVTVRLSGMQTLRTYGIRLHYDTTILKCVEVRSRGFFAGYQTFFFRQIDSVRALAGADESVLGSGHARGDGDLFTLTFQGLQYGVADLAFESIVLYDSAQLPLSIDGEGGRVIVGVGPPLSAAPAREFRLEAIYPNPAAESVTFTFASSRRERLRLAVYDAAGRCVAVLFDGDAEPGMHRLRFDVSSSGAGIVSRGSYFAVLSAGDRASVLRFTLQN